MDGLTSYEVQTYRDGVWTIQEFFDNAELALSDARRLVESRKYPGVRVVEETWCPDRQEFRPRVVYSRLNRKSASPSSGRQAPAPDKPERVPRESGPHVRPASAQKRPGVARLVLTAVLIVGAGIGALTLLHYGFG